MKTVVVNNIEIPVYDGSVGISLSGGADSAVLLYILMSNDAGPITAYNFAAAAKNRRTMHYSQVVIDKCKELTGYAGSIENETVLVERQQLGFMLDFFRGQVYQGNIKKLYMGTTQHPPDNVLDSFSDKLDAATYLDRNAGVNRPTESQDFVIPFRNANKKDIANIYKELGLTDTLFPLTRSCEDPAWLDGHCGKCWWCQERLWGFGRLE